MSPLAIAALVYVLTACAASAFFSATEMAILAANRYTLRRQSRSGSPAAARAVAILGDRKERLATNLVGLNIVMVSGAAVATYLVEMAIESNWLSTLVTTFAMTSVLLVASEIVPKVYARQNPERLLTKNSRWLDIIHLFFLPLTRGLSFYVGGIMRLMGLEETGSAVPREELKALLRETRAGSGVVQSEQRMLHSILEFGETVAREVMIPMSRVVALEKGAGLDQWKQLVRRHGYTRMPVYDERIENVVGVLNIFDLYYEEAKGDTVEAYMRPTPIYPDTKLIDRLLPEMQRSRNPMVAVVNEFGSCIGIVTIEDIVEEIVGEMSDEHEADVRRIRTIGPRTLMVDALTDIDDLNEELGLDLPLERYDTVGGLVLKRFGRIPAVGDTFTFRGIHFEVMDVYRYGVRSVKMVLPPDREEVDS